MNNNLNDSYELPWNGQITQDEVVYENLEKGFYIFKVIGFDRGRTKGSEKMPPCNMAKLKLEIESFDSSITGREMAHNLILWSKLEYKISEFFVAIGLKQKGQPFNIDFNKAIGLSGVCEIGIKQYNNKEYNQIVRFLDRKEAAEKIRESQNRQPQPTSTFDDGNLPF